MHELHKFVAEAIAEDVGRGCLFARCVEPTAASAMIRTKSDGIFCGVPYVEAIAEVKNLEVRFLKRDGEAIQAGETLLELEGSNTNLLIAERVMLNILQHASGIATMTRHYAHKLENTPIKLLDTRKTRPGMRRLEKYATRMGGAVNHRMGLDDCLMIKDTHLRTIPDLKGFIAHARKKIPFTANIEVECEDVETAEIALEAGVNIIMCDNMPPPMIRHIVYLRNKVSPRTMIEVSGNVSLENIEQFTSLGIDAISTGSLVHQATWLDFSMKMVGFTQGTLPGY